MDNLLILYAPDSPENRSVASELAVCFDPGRYAVTAKHAARSSITDVAAADLVVFCLQGSDAGTTVDFSELTRTFAAANLAGRVAAFASFGDQNASGRLRAALSDTDITQFREEAALSQAGSERAQVLKRWAQQLVSFQRALRDARE